MEQRETETTCEAEERSPQSHLEAEASVVPFASGEHHSITLNALKELILGYLLQGMVIRIWFLMPYRLQRKWILMSHPILR